MKDTVNFMESIMSLDSVKQTSLEAKREIEKIRSAQICKTKSVKRPKRKNSLEKQSLASLAVA